MYSCHVFHRDVLIEQLMREIVELKQRIQELEEQNSANLELIGGLRQQLEQVTSIYLSIHLSIYLFI